MKIHPVIREKGGNRYCGPAVLSALLKISTDDAARLLRHYSGKRSIRGTSTNLIRHTLNQSGIRSERVPVEGKPTLAGWLKAAKERRTDGRVYLIVAGNHWQLISGRRYVCGISKLVVSIADEVVKRRARVTEVYELADNGIKVPFVATKKPKQSTKHRKEIKSLKDRAAQLGIDVEYDRDLDKYEVWPPQYLDLTHETDPFYDQHFCYSWDEAKERIEAYIKLCEQSEGA